MLLETITDGLEAVTFAPDSGDFATCVLKLTGRDGTLLIDVGYERHAGAIVAALGESSPVTAIVLSHEHEDHVSGCVMIPAAQVIAAEGFPLGLIGDRIPEVPELGRPMRFGSHDLRFYTTPGHSHHHLMTLIDDHVAQVGDLLIFTHDGRPAPPYLADGASLRDHMRSLELLRNLEPEEVVPGHGPVLRGRQEIERAVELRLRYLSTLADATGPIPLTDCFPLAAAAVSRHDFHYSNLCKLGFGNASGAGSNV